MRRLFAVMRRETDTDPYSDYSYTELIGVYATEKDAKTVATRLETGGKESENASKFKRDEIEYEVVETFLYE